MSGNSAALGAELGAGNWHEAMVRGLAIPAFILGIALGAFSVEFARRSRCRAQLAPAFVLEMGFLVWYMLVARGSPPLPTGTPGFFFRVWLLAAAMGLQSATLRRADGARVRTTYISGMITNMTEDAVLYLLKGLQRNSNQTEEPGSRGVIRRRVLIFGLIFLAFLVGGMCGGFGETKLGPMVLLAPLAGLIVMVLDDWFSPMRHGPG